MASLSTDKQGNRTIFVYVPPDGIRKAIRLGRVPLKNAESFQRHVEALAAAKALGDSPSVAVAEWFGSLDDAMAARVAATGLIPPRAKPEPTAIGNATAAYIARRTDAKPRTTNNLEQSRGWLLKYFGESRSLAEIQPGDADEFRLWLLERLGENTVRRHCGRAKQIFRAFVRKGLLQSNPFGDMKGCGVVPNKARDYFVTADEARKVLEACPGTQWKLLFALARWGALRIPSEASRLTWRDVDWERGRLTIRSPKTEHIEGKDSRVIPLFPEIRKHLDAAYAEAPERAERVLSLPALKAGGSANLRTQMHRIIEAAGLEPWAKTFHNLRASRETELAQSFPLHVVVAWCGNSQPVAMNHYLRTTDADFERAIAPPESAAKSVAREAQQGAAVESAPTRTELHESSQADSGQSVVPILAGPCDSVHMYTIPPTGVEPVLPD